MMDSLASNLYYIQKDEVKDIKTQKEEEGEEKRRERVK